MQAQREPHDAPEPPLRPAEELGEVVAGDVLHDLPARTRDRAAGEHDGRADHEVAHRPVAVSPRAGQVRRQAGAEARVAGRVEGEHLPVRRERPPESGETDLRLDGTREVAGLVLEDPVEWAFRNARQGLPSRADAAGRGPAPPRRAEASGTSCRGWRDLPGRTRGGAASWSRGRPARTSSASR